MGTDGFKANPSGVQGVHRALHPAHRTRVRQRDWGDIRGLGECNVLITAHLDIPRLPIGPYLEESERGRTAQYSDAVGSFLTVSHNRRGDLRRGVHGERHWNVLFPLLAPSWSGHASDLGGWSLVT